MSALSDRKIERSPIKAPAMNITLGTAGALSLGATLTVWKDAFEFLFGDNAPYGTRAAVLIATIAAIVLLAAADMLARAIATRRDVRHVMAMGQGWTASIHKPEADESGFTVAAVRASDAASSDPEYLLIKAGTAPAWHPATGITLIPPS